MNTPESDAIIGPLSTGEVVFGVAAIAAIYYGTRALFRKVTGENS